MGKFFNMKGLKFGWLTVLERVENSKTLGVCWLCRCRCGNERVYPSRYLVEGRAVSCGCHRAYCDLTGRSFNQLFVVGEAPRRGTHRYWECVCACGEVLEVREWNLTSGAARSCGCVSVEGSRLRGTRHGLSGTRIYSIWQGINDRCNRHTSKNYIGYGSRGINNKFKGFISFKNWAFANGYSDDLSIDRIDNDEGYSPDNCKWSNKVQQANNRRSNNVLHFYNSSFTIREWSRKLNINHSTLEGRINRGWSTQRALTTRPGKYRRG